MKTVWVLAGWAYYTDEDNFQGSFHSYEEADEFVKSEQIQAFDWFTIIDVADRL